MEEVHEVIYDHYSGAAEKRQLLGKTIETLYPQWLEYKRLITPAPTTITRLQSDWKKYYEGTPIIKVPIVRLKKLDLDKWAHKLIRERELTSKQYSNLRAIMNQVLDYAVDLEIIETNPFEKVKIRGKHLFRPVKDKPPEERIYSVDEEKTVKEMAWKVLPMPSISGMSCQKHIVTASVSNKTRLPMSWHLMVIPTPMPCTVQVSLLLPKLSLICGGMARVPISLLLLNCVCSMRLNVLSIHISIDVEVMLFQMLLTNVGIGQARKSKDRNLLRHGCFPYHLEHFKKRLKDRHIKYVLSLRYTTNINYFFKANGRNQRTSNCL